MNLALNLLPSDPLGQNISDKRPTVAELFRPTPAFLRHFRCVDVGETDHHACNLECVTINWSYRPRDGLC